jgi:hypothetical protein
VLGLSIEIQKENLDMEYLQKWAKRFRIELKKEKL